MTTSTDASSISAELRALAAAPGVQLAWQETILKAADFLDGAIPAPEEAAPPEEEVAPEPVDPVEEVSNGMVAQADTAGNRKKGK